MTYGERKRSMWPQRWRRLALSYSLFYCCEGHSYSNCHRQGRTPDRSLRRTYYEVRRSGSSSYAHLDGIWHSCWSTAPHRLTALGGARTEPHLPNLASSTWKSLLWDSVDWAENLESGHSLRLLPPRCVLSVSLVQLSAWDQKSEASFSASPATHKHSLSTYFVLMDCIFSNDPV